MRAHYYTLITGAGKGLGKALAFECAHRQMNLVLVSLPGENLMELTYDLKRTYDIDAIAIEKDLCLDRSCLEVFNEIKERRLRVNTLINNAGVGGTELFKHGLIGDYEKQIRLNVLATTLITRLFLDTLRENGPAYILNVGSLACFFSLAKKQVYGATKSYVSYFSRSLRRELKQESVFVSLLCPGGMYTNEAASETLKTGNYISRSSGMRPEEVAPIAIDGLLKNKQVIIPGKINRLVILLNRVLPRFIVNFFEAMTMQRLHKPTGVQPTSKSCSSPVYSNLLNQ